MQEPLQSSYNASFDQVYANVTGSLDKSDAFQFSLQQLYPLLESLENTSPVPDRKPLTSAVTHAEFLLWSLNDVDIKVHPFLSHWVETVLRLQEKLASGAGAGIRKSSNSNGEDKEANFAWAMAMKTRLEVIRCILAVDTKVLGQETPQSLVERAMNGRSVDVKQALEWLYEGGVWDRPSPALPDPFLSSSEPPGLSTRTKSSDQPQPPLKNGTDNPPTTDSTIPDTPPEPPPSKLPKADETLKDLRAALALDPTSTILDLRHLPIALPNLETITTFLTSPLPSDYAIDAASFSRDYIQHCLRTLEAKTVPVDADDPFAAAVRGIDREEVGRLVRLLLLFMRSLLDKGVCGFGELEWEFREVFVRYVWVPEVREMREVFGVDEMGWWEEDGGGG